MTAHASLAFVLVVGLAPAPPPTTTPPPPPTPSAAPSPNRVDAHAHVRAALARLPPGPSLREVQAAALAHAGLDLRASARWQARARRAAALPVVSLQWDRRFDRGWTLDEAVGAADALRNDAGQQDSVRVRATWELDRLWFSPDELRAARASLDVADVRERVLLEVTRLYFERERLRVEGVLATPSDDPVDDLTRALDLELRLREVEGLLTGMTGLEFDPTSAAPAGPASPPKPAEI